MVLTTFEIVNRRWIWLSESGIQTREFYSSKHDDFSVGKWLKDWNYLCLIAGNRSDWGRKRKETGREERRKLIETLNGDVLAPIYHWPINIRRIFFKTTPISDAETFQLSLFFIGNSASPEMAGDCVMISHSMSPQSGMDRVIRKRINQIVWIQDNIENHYEWRYFDLCFKCVKFWFGKSPSYMCSQISWYLLLTFTQHLFQEYRGSKQIWSIRNLTILWS